MRVGILPCEETHSVLILKQTISLKVLSCLGRGKKSSVSEDEERHFVQHLGGGDHSLYRSWTHLWPSLLSAVFLYLPSCLSDVCKWVWNAGSDLQAVLNPRWGAGLGREQSQCQMPWEQRTELGALSLWKTSKADHICRLFLSLMGVEAETLVQVYWCLGG